MAVGNFKQLFRCQSPRCLTDLECDSTGDTNENGHVQEGRGPTETTSSKVTSKGSNLGETDFDLPKQLGQASAPITKIMMVKQSQLDKTQRGKSAKSFLILAMTSAWGAH